MYALPDPSGLQAIAAEFGIELSAADAEAYHGFLGGAAPGLRLLERMPDPTPAVKYPRTPGYRPEGDANPYNAWYYKTEIRGADEGPLQGKHVAIKDNIAVAGVPLANGSSVLEGHVPEADATVVERVLDAGAVIDGKATCEYFCVCASSVTSAHGRVENPRVPGHTPGGSSNGNAALVAAHEVDMAIGADQAGSIRVPASFSGIVGHKPTFGLVPYTGALGIEHSIDYLGPMADSVADCALLLDVLAGDDGVDTRQKNVRLQSCGEAIGQGVSGLRVGVVAEGFGGPESESEVDQSVKDAADWLGTQGATVEQISIPWHSFGPAIWMPISIEGFHHQLALSHGINYGGGSAYSLSFMRALAGWQQHANELPHTVKSMLVTGEIFNRHGGRLYAKARNMAARLRAEYDAWLDRYDVLVMPTTPKTATPLLPQDAPPETVLHDAWSAMDNTCPFNATGHPAASVCCGTAAGKPVGFMIVGRHFDDATVLRVADTVHQQQ